MKFNALNTVLGLEANGAESATLLASDTDYKPINMRLLNVDEFIIEYGVGRVSSPAIKEPSSINFHADGLFSEEIFGLVGSPERLNKFGYIELNAEILTPIAYQTVTKLSALYDEIMSGASYATWDDIGKDFVRVYGDPEDTPGADTGYTFFLKHFSEIQFKTTSSTKRDSKIELIEKYRDVCLIRRFIVLPAGLRDIQMDGGRLSQDDVNKLYNALLAMSFSIPPGSKDPILDYVRYRVQRKAFEIYNHFENIFTGKKGYALGAYGHRKIAWGTRNVITAANYVSSTPNDPRGLSHDETRVGIYQTAKGLALIVSHHVKTFFIDPIFGYGDIAQVALTNMTTHELEYVDINYKEYESIGTISGIKDIISKFGNKDFRNKPVIVTKADGINYCLCLVYDTGDSISILRSKSDLLQKIPDADVRQLRPITWAEILYMTSVIAANGRHALITRYPVIEDGSTYPSKIQVESTIPSRQVKVLDLLTGKSDAEYLRYPILSANAYLDSVQLDTSHLAGLGADHDGDMISVNYILTNEANEECRQLLEEKYSSYLSPERIFLSSGGTDLTNLMLINTTSPAPESGTKIPLKLIEEFKSKEVRVVV